jgi:hypothetical protein
MKTNAAVRRFLIPALVFCNALSLCDPAALAATCAYDSSSGVGSGVQRDPLGTTIAFSQTTGTSPEIVMVYSVASQTGNGHPTISSVADTDATHVWHSYVQYEWGADSDGNGSTMELWWSNWPTAETKTITVTYNSLPSHSAAVAIGFGIIGAYSATAPFDTNLSLPSEANNPTSSSTAPSWTFATTEATDVLLLLCNGSGANCSSGAPTGFRTLASNSQGSGGGGVASAGQVAYAQSVTSATTSTTYTESAIADWGAVGTAIACSAPPGGIAGSLLLLGVGN